MMTLRKISPRRYTIEGKPMSINNAKRPLPVKGKLRLVTTGSARKWKDSAKVQLMAQHMPAPAIEIPCEVCIDLYLPTLAGDADNYVKLTLDALQDARVIANDRQVQRLTVSKQKDKENPRTEITITTP